MSPASPRDVQRKNAAIFREHGPGLRYDYGTFVVARSPSTGEIKLGGLGAMGVGQMWLTEGDRDATLPGYDDCEIIARGSTGPFGD